MTALRVSTICAEVDVRLIPTYVNRSPGASKCSNVMERILWVHGECHLTMVLRTIMENETNRMALVTPVLLAVSDVIHEHPEWAGGPEWLEAFDTIDLCELFQTARANQAAVSRRAAIATGIHEFLASRFGRPTTASPKKRRLTNVKGATAGPPMSKAQTAKVCAAEALPHAKLWAAPPSPEVRAETIQRILSSHDRLDVEVTARAEMERLLRYHDAGHVNLLIVTIIESENNENALVAPVIQAVHDVMRRRRNWAERGGEWLEAFDQLPPLLSILDDMRALDLFHETSLGKYLGMIMENKLKKHFEPSVERSKIQPPQVERKPVAERVIEEGLFLLQHKGPHKTSRITKLAHERFGLDANDCGRAINAARLYGDRMGLVQGLSREALYALSSPGTLPAVREAIERRLQLGEKIGAPEILRLRRSHRQATA